MNSGASTMSRVFESDFDALKLLKQHGVEERRNGLIRANWRELNDDCRDAVRYLLDEWDFEYEAIGAPHE